MSSDGGKILGFWSGHDASFCVLDDGRIELHTEAERHLRVKEPPYDSIKLFYEHDGDVDGVIGLATCHLSKGITDHAESWRRISSLGVPLYVSGHHQAHAANAFYSSPYEEAIVITVDGGGIEDDRGYTVGASVWHGRGNRLLLKRYYPLEQVNVGGVWSRATRHVFRFESGHPYGNQAGSTMALAALAKDPRRFEPIFKAAFTSAVIQATVRAPGDVRGKSAKDADLPEHPFWKPVADAAARDEQTMYDAAGALQLVTDSFFRLILDEALGMVPGVKNVCFSGGVALNSCAMGTLALERPSLSFFVPPVPYDAGLTLGAAQHAWHHVLGRPRVDLGPGGASPFLGKTYSRSDVDSAVASCSDRLVVASASDDLVLDALAEGKIVAVFNGRAESGRRALGNRSILADPRRAEMKDRLNLVTKDRATYRPFAPSIKRESVKGWFEKDVNSPYMSFVVKFWPDLARDVPAVVHFDGSARLQTVRRELNPWYYDFLDRWDSKTGCPILLNTSFNSKEPICEEPIHAIDCFLRTDIDHLYFPEHGLILSKR